MEDNKAFTLVEEINPSVEDDFDGAINDMITPRVGDTPVYIDDLTDVVVDGQWTAKEGDVIVVEKWNCLNPNKPRWMGTALYTIRRIDPFTGDVTMHDDELQQSCMTHITKGPRRGWRFKFADKNVNLNKRAKPAEFVEEKKQKEEKAARPAKLRKDGQPFKKRAQNRPKSVVAAEKATRAKEMADKKAAKAAKKEAKRAERDAERQARKAAKASAKQSM